MVGIKGDNYILNENQSLWLAICIEHAKFEFFLTSESQSSLFSKFCKCLSVTEAKPYKPVELHYPMKWGSIISDTFLFQGGARKETWLSKHGYMHGSCFISNVNNASHFAVIETNRRLKTLFSSSGIPWAVYNKIPVTNHKNRNENQAKGKKTQNNRFSSHRSSANICIAFVAS